MTWKGSKNPTVNFAYSRIHPVHNDISVYSEIIGVRITFHWRPIIDEEVLYEVELWSKPPYKYTPTFILMGKISKKFIVGYQKIKLFIYICFRNFNSSHAEGERTKHISIP